MPEAPAQKSSKFKLELTIPGVDQKNLPTDNFLIFSIFFVAIYFMVVFYFIVPQFKSAMTAYRRLQNAKTEQKTYNDRIARINDVLEKTDYQDSISLVDQILYNTNPYVEVYLNIEALAKKYNLDLNGLEYSPGYVATPSAVIASGSSSEENYLIEFAATGNYLDIVNFLTDIESQAPMSSVATARINNNLEEGFASAQIGIFAHYHVPVVLISDTTDLSPLGPDEQWTLQQLQKFQRSSYDVYLDVLEPQAKLDLFALTDAGLTLDGVEEDNFETTVFMDEYGNLVDQYGDPLE